MKKHYLLCIAFSIMTAGYVAAQQRNTGGSMPGPYTQPMVEEALRNITLQNRAGNRVTMMFFEDHAEMQYVYKPNAFRRKDYRARNFSNRDNYTTLFSSFSLPQLKESYVDNWDYDPFVTRIGFRTPWEAKGKFTVINLADENAFALVSKAPLMLTIKPHHAFMVSDGLLTEQFTDRGEEIVSFVKFNSMEENRFRVTTDGEYVLQIFENEVIIVGGEENMHQVDRVVKKFEGLGFDELLARNESVVSEGMEKGVFSFKNPDFQRVLDLNRRIVWSGIDAGGACFGAINRIYYLIWVRDGSMTSAQMARAGNPELINIWAKFLLNNPNIMTMEDGTKVPGFQQIVGTRWTKNEDDGVYYAALSLFTYYETTGKTDLVQGSEFELLLDVIDHYIEDVWDEDRGMVVSDTRGETPLKSNPYFGYDVVNGNFERNRHHEAGGRVISSAASLYNQVNTFNIMEMARIMLAQRPEIDNGRSARYGSIASRIRETVNTKYVNKSGELYAEYLEFDDGSTFWQPFAEGADYWEYGWAVSTGPFFPAPAYQLASAKMIPDRWPKIRTYGYCPWNTVSRTLYEYGLSSEAYEKMLGDEVREAMMLTKKYPMQGALTEYNTAVESWRGLPFSASSFFFTTSAQALQSMPMGIGVRASNNVDTMRNFQFRLSYIDLFAQGEGDHVASYTLNGEAIPYTLQLPDSKMRFGNNVIRVNRSKKSGEGFRLYSSSAELLDMRVEGDRIIFTMHSPVEAELVFEHSGKADLSFTGADGRPLAFEQVRLPGTEMQHFRVGSDGDFTVTAVMKSK